MAIFLHVAGSAMFMTLPIPDKPGLAMVTVLALKLAWLAWVAHVFVTASNRVSQCNVQASEP